MRVIRKRDRLMRDPTHSTASTAREKLIEHLFVGEVLKHLWIAGHRDVEVLRAEFDARGYDLVIEAGGVMRHIQLKSAASGAKTAKVSISRDLARKPGGCVVWIWFDPETLGRYSGSAGNPVSRCRISATGWRGTQKPTVRVKRLNGPICAS